MPESSERRKKGALTSTAVLVPVEFGQRHEVGHKCTVAVVEPGLSCPVCNGKGHRRQGPEFDHLRRCGKCDVSWEPGRLYLLFAVERRQKAGL